MTTSFQQLAHSLRITVSFNAGDSALKQGSTSADVCVPAAASLADALEELEEAAGAPIISVPWQARTAGGTDISMSEPLSLSGVSHGDIIFFTPVEEAAPSISKNSAEALSDLGSELDARGLAAASTVVGLAALTLLAGRSGLPNVPHFALFLLLALGLIAVTAWLRFTAPGEVLAKNVLAVGSSVMAGTSVWMLVAGPTIPTDWAQRGWILLASLSALIGVFAFLTWVTGLSWACVAGVGSASVLATVFAVALLIVRTQLNAAAVLIFVACVFLLLAPNLATTLAGLSVPPLPAAGQDLKVADHTISDPDAKAVRATSLLDGLCIGIGLCASVALIYQGIHAAQPGFTTALCVANSMAIAMHAARHRSTGAMWGLWVWTCAGVLGASIAGLSAGAGGVLVSLLAGAIAVSAPLWAAQVRHLPPTTLNWLEKLEALALATALPLAAHLAGLFDAIRSL
ncbi:type VII secretion integral membrane protein EccD [Corynebacterium sp. H130]|uniref:type VII secretion integral membrane protein EccD n=1 Tax=Corynebacterium sp. H130 TaxID=3133444 RepID=UPI0030AA9500